MHIQGWLKTLKLFNDCQDHFLVLKLPKNLPRVMIQQVLKPKEIVQYLDPQNIF